MAEARDEVAPAVRQQYLTRLRQLDVAQERWKVGVIGEREGGVGAVAVARAAVERPTREHRRARGTTAHRLRQGASRGRPNQDARPVERGDIVAHVGRQCDAGFLVDAGHRADRAVRHERQAGATENRERLLGFPERVRVEDRNRPVFERFARPLDHRARDLGARRKDVLRPAVGALHQHDVAALHFGRLGRVRGLQLEIARVDEAARFAFDQELRAAQDVTGREERQRVFADRPRLVELVRLEDDLRPLPTEALLADPGVVHRGHDDVVGAGVIGVTVRNEAARTWPHRVDPEVEIADVERLLSERKHGERLFDFRFLLPGGFGSAEARHTGRDRVNRRRAPEAQEAARGRQGSPRMASRRRGRGRCCRAEGRTANLAIFARSCPNTPPQRR